MNLAHQVVKGYTVLIIKYRFYYHIIREQEEWKRFIGTCRGCVIMDC